MKISVNTGKPYQVVIEKGSLAFAGSYMKESGSSGKAAVITDDVVDALYGDKLVSSLELSGFEVCRMAVPHGEGSKSLGTLEKVYGFLSENSVTRSDRIVALGGGVVGDLAGFAASTWLRGVSYIQVPTTFLAAIDSSVGGKTAVNIPEGKNLIGSFWQPSLVICDPDTLSTLSDEIFADGMAEAVKYGCIWDQELFRLLEAQPVMDHLERIIARCVEIKAQVVSADERDHGLRNILNFGHTMGHAIEKYHRFSISHGKGVAVGMVLAAEAGEAAGITSPGTARRIKALLTASGLPTEDEAPLDTLCALCLGDKKRDGQRLNLILLEELGKAVIHPILTDEVEAFITQKG